jgi:hypothetical protein
MSYHGADPLAALRMVLNFIFAAIDLHSIAHLEALVGGVSYRRGIRLLFTQHGVRPFFQLSVDGMFADYVEPFYHEGGPKAIKFFSHENILSQPSTVSSSY